MSLLSMKCYTKFFRSRLLWQDLCKINFLPVVLPTVQKILLFTNEIQHYGMLHSPFIITRVSAVCVSSFFVSAMPLEYN